MPDFLSGTKDLYIQKDNIKVANYITENIVVGNILEIKNIKDYSKLDNKIVLLKNADPGYDFIFSRKLKGLITCYGGANSHMSIRCLELDIPAIIGVGSELSNLDVYLRKMGRKFDISVRKIPKEFYSNEAFNRSDQISFAKAGIPSILILDSPEYVNLDRASAIEKII